MEKEEKKAASEWGDGPATTHGLASVVRPDGGG